LASGDADLQKSMEAAARRTQASDVAPHPLWSSIDFIQALLHLADDHGTDAVLPIFSGALSSCPELLLYGLSQCTPSWGPAYGRLLSTLMGRFLSDPASINVVRHVWSLDKTLVLQGMADLAAASGKQGFARCLQLAQELGLLLEILSLKHSWKFIIEFAVYAAQHNAIPFANWAAKNAEEGQSEFAQAAVALLRERSLGGEPDSEQVIPGDYAATLTQALQAGAFDPVITAEIHLLAFQSHGQSGASRTPAPAGAPTSAVGFTGDAGGDSGMAGMAGGGEMGAGMMEGIADGVQAGGDMQQGQGQHNALFAQDIEEEANSHFQRIYNSEIQIEAVVNMLKNFKNSQEQREQEVFACMIHNLFDEYRFFPRYDLLSCARALSHPVARSCSLVFSRVLSCSLVLSCFCAFALGLTSSRSLTRWRLPQVPRARAAHHRQALRLAHPAPARFIDHAGHRAALRARGAAQAAPQQHVSLWHVRARAVQAAARRVAPILPPHPADQSRAPVTCRAR
jgi:hypothetical protein